MLEPTGEVIDGGSLRDDTDLGELAGMEPTGEVDDAGEATPLDKDKVYTVTELVKEVQDGTRKVSIMSIAKGGDRVQISGVIGEVDPYKYNIFDEEYEPQLRLESGLPEVSFAGVKEHLIECEFVKPEQLKELSIGQTVVISGEITWSVSFGGPKTFDMSKCELVSAQPHTGVSAPFYVGQDVKDYGEDGEKLQAVYDAIKKAELDYFDLNEDDLRMRVEVPASFGEDEERLPAPALAALNSVPIIERMEVGSYSAVPNALAVDLGKVRYCEKLKVESAKLEKTGLEAMVSIPGVTALELWYPVLLEAEDYSILGKAPQLRQLRILGKHDEKLLIENADAALDHLKELTQLRSLSLGKIDLTDAGLAVLAEFSHLRFLKIEECSSSGSGLIHLAHPEIIWELSYTGETVTDDIVEPLRKCHEIVLLDLSNTSVTSRIGEGIADMVSLSTINLFKAPVDNAIGPHLGKLTSLNTLHMTRTQINDEFVIPVQSMESFRFVNLSNTQVAGNVCEQLGASPTLTKIHLDETPVDDAALKRLAASPETSKLQYLSLKDTEVTELGLLELIPLKELKKVTVSKAFPLKLDTLKKIEAEASFEVELSRY